MLRQILLRLGWRRERGLFRAAEDGRLEVVRTLLEAGVDPNAACDRGFTAMMWAAARGHVEVIKALLEFGAERESRTQKGRTAVDIAIQEGHDDIAAFLRETEDPT
jgi:ankyrin repeat protein